MFAHTKHGELLRLMPKRLATQDMCDSRTLHQGAPFFSSHQRISQRAVLTSLEKQLDPRGPTASWGGGGGSTSLSKETYTIATCDFQRGLASGGGGMGVL